MTLSNFPCARGSYLYALVDPAEPKHYRYIGKAKNPTRRLDRHIREVATSPEHSYKINWLRKVILEGCMPELKVLAIVEDRMTASTERRAIAAYREAGHRLTNGTLGGEGCDPPIPEVRAKRNAAVKAAFACPDVKERHRAAIKAALARPEVKERHRAALKSALARPEVQIARLTRQLERLSCRVA